MYLAVASVMLSGILSSTLCGGKIVQVFDGFSQDMVQDFTGLKAWEVRRIREYGIVVPEKTAVGFKYSFADVLMLRLCKELKYRYEVSLNNIKRANQYFALLDPSTKLDNYRLFVRSDTGEILFFGDEYNGDEALINASKLGQLAIKGAIIILPVGKHLEHVRQNLVRLDERLSKSLKSRKFISLGEMKRKYGG